MLITCRRLYSTSTTSTEENPEPSVFQSQWRERHQKSKTLHPINITYVSLLPFRNVINSRLVLMLRLLFIPHKAVLCYLFILGDFLEMIHVLCRQVSYSVVDRDSTVSARCAFLSKTRRSGSFLDKCKGPSPCELKTLCRCSTNIVNISVIMPFKHIIHYVSKLKTLTYIISY